jgi:hypothetical protein
MSSAVQALISGETPERHRGKGGYQSWCACCAPQDAALLGKPQRRTHQRPQLAWRSRQAALQACGEGESRAL